MSAVTSRNTPPPPDFGPVLGYPSGGHQTGPLWRILWTMLYEASEPLPLRELAAQACAEYAEQNGHPVAEITAVNLVRGAARAGHLDEVALPGHRLPAYQLPGTGSEIVL